MVLPQAVSESRMQHPAAIVVIVFMIFPFAVLRAALEAMFIASGCRHNECSGQDLQYR
jgi:hypothetical protein